jgi:type VI secretion system protein ImpG
VVHADRTRLRDFEIYRLLRVEDADSDGPDARVQPLYSASQNRGGGYVYATERRPRRPGEDEVRRGQTRTGYPGDDFFVSVSRMPNATTQQTIKRLDIRALCTNRDLCVLDDTPVLTMESGDPVDEIRLLQAFQRPRPSLTQHAPQSIGAEAEMDDIAWRLIAQLSLNYLSLAEDGKDAEPLRAMLDLYADRGDPRLSRHVKSITKITSKPVVERLGISGPICFGHGIDITLHIDDSILVGNSSLLLSALLSKLFARHASINSFVRTRSFLTQEQEDVVWPMTPGNRKII